VALRITQSARHKTQSTLCQKKVYLFSAFCLNQDFQDNSGNSQILRNKDNRHLPLYDREDIALKKIVKSEFTAKIHEADKARDEIYTGMAEMNAVIAKYAEALHRRGHRSSTNNNQENGV
jgi:hypothetical protein